MDKNLYIDTDSLINKWHEIHVWGTGVMAERLTVEVCNKLNIINYIDNNASECDGKYLEKPVISAESYFDLKSENPIVISSCSYANEIAAQLREYGLVPGEDFFVWDNEHNFHIDENTEKYIQLMKSMWKSYHKSSGKNIVLVPITLKHDLEYFAGACCANYMAEIHNAQIVGYMREDAKLDNIPLPYKQISESINMTSIVDVKIDKQLQEKVDKICEVIWKDLYTWEDWYNITIYGIRFGSTIVRAILRTQMIEHNLRTKKMYKYLKKIVTSIAFWSEYFHKNEVKVVFLTDGVGWSGIIRDIAVNASIDTYIMCDTMQKATLNHHIKPQYKYFNVMWDQLTEKEKKYGIAWAKEHLEKRINGDSNDLLNKWDQRDFAFGEQETVNRILEENDKLKILICPHSFEEDSCPNGGNIFFDNYFEWLCHLGELSEKTPDYDWYMKPHPQSRGRDTAIIDLIVEKYPRIKKLPTNISPKQLKKEGIEYALTVHGSIGHEYPYIGIHVINAGANPHEAFNFNSNPKTIEEYDSLIMNLDKNPPMDDLEELYKFYSLNYLFYDWDRYKFCNLFFVNPRLGVTDSREFSAINEKWGTWIYREFIDTLPDNWEEKIMNKLPTLFRELEEWQPDILYKKEL